MNYTKAELKEVKRSIESTIYKCEKVLKKLRVGSSQHTLTDRRIKAFHLFLTLIECEMNALEVV